MKRRSRKPKQAAPEVHEAYVSFVEGVLLSQMKGLVRSRDVEEQYVGLRDRIREATEQQMTTLARRAAEYYVSHCNLGSPRSLPKDEVDRLKKEALDHALNSTK